MIPIRIYDDCIYNAVEIIMSTWYDPAIDSTPSSKISMIIYEGEEGTRKFVLVHPSMKIWMDGMTYSMDSAYDVDAFIETFNTLSALEDLK